MNLPRNKTERLRGNYLSSITVAAFERGHHDVSITYFSLETQAKNKYKLKPHINIVLHAVWALLKKLR